MTDDEKDEATLYAFQVDRNPHAGRIEKLLARAYSDALCEIDHLRGELDDALASSPPRQIYADGESTLIDLLVHACCGSGEKN